MITGDLLKNYDINASKEITKLRDLLSMIDENSIYFLTRYSEVLSKYYATALWEVYERVITFNITKDDKMLNLIRLLLEFEFVLVTYYNSILSLSINYYKNIVDRLNYSIKFDQDRNEIIFFKKNLYLEDAIHEINDERVKWRIYEFNMLGSTIDSKIDTLREIYVLFESKKESKANKIIGEAMRYINVTRHANPNQDKELAEQYSRQKEDFIQICFMLSLQALINLDINKLKEVIKKL
ncbi:hypothetical protein N7603_04960 [Acholeplasma vituli]|uniref:RiboL-PSP-HEPN domain-containing protein n=1 Tax=Paracholeplasma vituli TaxID=69473 RepID=A0ABT2PX32_9MOLU|nr:hypothetical protein [Paracholeplasma vituli]MCU0105001.1 hypothetical protein [Paracholeplasma vituli]